MSRSCDRAGCTEAAVHPVHLHFPGDRAVTWADLCVEHRSEAIQQGVLVDRESGRYVLPGGGLGELATGPRRVERAPAVRVRVRVPPQPDPLPPEVIARIRAEQQAEEARREALRQKAADLAERRRTGKRKLEPGSRAGQGEGDRACAWCGGLFVSKPWAHQGRPRTYCEDCSLGGRVVR